MFGSVRFLFERYQASWISQQKVVESAGSLNFMGIPIMRTITATTAFKMPLHGISFPLSASSVSSTVFRNTEKLSCANEVSASQPLFIIKACFYPTEVFPVTKFTLFLIIKAQIFCALINCINPILQPRSPVMDYRGFFIFFSKKCHYACQECSYAT